MFYSKVTLFIILASLLTCDCLFRNIIQNVGKTVSGVYKCTRNIISSPTSKQNFYDLRLEIKDGKVQIWLPDTGMDQMNKMPNIGTPEISSNSRINTPVLISDYPEKRTRTMSDLLSSGSHIRSQESRTPYTNPAIHNYPIYHNMMRPMTSMVMPMQFSPEYSNKFLDVLLPPPPVTSNSNLQTVQNVDKNDINSSGITSSRNYKTIPYSKYSENYIGNGLMETANSLADYLNKLLKNIPLYYL